MKTSIFIRIHVALELVSALICGMAWLFGGVEDVMTEYPTRPIAQILFAVGLGPQLLIVGLWALKSRITGILSFAVLLFRAMSVFITKQDEKFLSGQCDLMAHLCTCCFMLYTAFALPHTQPLKVVAIAYCLCQLLLLHFLGRHLQTGHDDSLFFEACSLLISLLYQWLTMENFDKGTLEISWSTGGNIHKAGKIA